MCCLICSKAIAYTGKCMRNHGIFHFCLKQQVCAKGCWAVTDSKAQTSLRIEKPHYDTVLVRLTTAIRSLLQFPVLLQTSFPQSPQVTDEKATLGQWLRIGNIESTI